MSVRRAVISQLKSQVAALGGRVYQAFLTPANVQSPYATVKIAGIRSTPEISYAGDQQVEVYIYRIQDDFISLDGIRHSVVMALNGVTLVDVPTGERYWLRWFPTGLLDFVDEDRKLIGCVVMFETSVIYERSI